MSTTTTASTMDIFALPNELLFSISEYLPNESLRVGNFTSRHLHPITCDTLLRRNATLPELSYGKVARTPFHKAAKVGNIAQLKGYLPKLGRNKNAIINRRDHGGFTPLHSASIAGHAEVIWNLLQHGADSRIVDQAGNTALHIATEFKHYGAMVMLLGNGADVNAAASGFTPLHLATYHGDLEAVEILLDAGADEDALCLGLKPVQVGEIMAESRREKNVVCAKLFATKDCRCLNKKCTRKVQYKLREAKGGLGLAELKLEGEDVVDFFWE